jgi:uncharacterized protein YlbG (UPF0298 family)
MKATVISEDQINDWLAKLNEIRATVYLKGVDVSSIANLINEFEEIHYVEIIKDDDDYEV